MKYIRAPGNSGSDDDVGVSTVMKRNNTCFTVQKSATQIIVMDEYHESIGYTKDVVVNYFTLLLFSVLDGLLYHHISIPRGT